MLSSRHRGGRSPPVRQAARLLRDHFPARELPRSRQRAGRRPTNARRCTRRRCSQGTTCSRIAEVHRLTLRLWRQRWTIRARRTAAWQGPNNLVAHALSMCSRKHSLPARAIRNGTVAGWKLPAAAPAASADARSCSAGSVSPVHDGGTGAGRPQAKISYLVGLFGAVEKTRTSTGFRPQRPQRCASTNSATTAKSSGCDCRPGGVGARP